jgi:hypothetical protein
MNTGETKINQDVKVEGATVQYITGPAEAMMESMVGRAKIKGEWAIFPGFEIGIQSLEIIRDHVPSYSPDKDKRSSQQILRDNFGDKFDLLISVPNPRGAERAMIWYLTPEEFELAHEWELIEQGMQEDVKGLAITEEGEFRAVTVNALQRPPFRVDKVVYSDEYVPYVAPVDQMHQIADESREQFLEKK